MCSRPIGVVSMFLAAGMAITAVLVFIPFYKIQDDWGYKVLAGITDFFGKAFSFLGIKSSLSLSTLRMMVLVSSGTTIFAAGLQALAALKLSAGDSVYYSMSTLICLVACAGSGVVSMQVSNPMDSDWSALTVFQWWQILTIINAGFLLFAWLQTTCIACSNRSQLWVGRRATVFGMV